MVSSHQKWTNKPLKHTMRKIFLYLSLVLGITGLQAQQRPNSSQYTQNLFLINPAVAGWENYVDIHSAYRKQWLGLANAPESYYVSVHGAMNYYAEPSKTLPMLSKHSLNMQRKLELGKSIWYRHGAGITAAVDKTSPLKMNTVQASYALHVQLGKELKGSVGASLGVRQWRLNPSDLNLEDQNDPVFSGEFMSEIIPNINVGLLLYSKKWYLSLSVDQLLKEQIGFGLEGVGVLQWHAYASLGYRWAAGNNWQLTPSILLRYTENASPVIEGNLLFQYREKLWGGVGYRQEGFAMVQAGVFLREWLNLAYTYEAVTGATNAFGGSSHEITLGVRIPVREYGFNRQYF